MAGGPFSSEEYRQYNSDNDFRDRLFNDAKQAGINDYDTLDKMTRSIAKPETITDAS
jgi:hypothetical protein